MPIVVYEKRTCTTCRKLAALLKERGTVIAAMVERPELLQRPLVVNGDRAVLARPIERAEEIL